MSSLISALHSCRFSFRKGGDMSHRWDGGFVLLALLLSDTEPLPRHSPRCPKTWHIYAEADILTSHCLNFSMQRKPPSKIFNNLIIPFGFPPPLLDKCQPLYLGWPGLMSPAWAPTSTYSHNLLVNVADFFFYVTGTLLPSKRVN